MDQMPLATRAWNASFKRTLNILQLKLERIKTQSRSMDVRHVPTETIYRTNSDAQNRSISLDILYEIIPDHVWCEQNITIDYIVLYLHVSEHFWLKVKRVACKVVQ
jgi:hypothetical protein